MSVLKLLGNLDKFVVVDWAYTDISRPKSFDYYENWIKQNKNLPLHYLSDFRKDIRQDIKNYFPTFKSAVVLLLSYAKEKKLLENFYIQILVIIH